MLYDNLGIVEADTVVHCC